ncbi:MAG: hypothetical protein KJ709_02965 [Nanoarchaeota archaeon]|nr:hypothetical protein [Nanoarchaeota archaeon]
MEGSWEECLEFSSAIRITPDKAKVKSLLETAKGRVRFVKRYPLEEDNANYVFEDIYSSIVEVLHTIVLLDGFKVRNHICLGFYLRDVLKREDLFRMFDDCRYKRNHLVYYGRRMGFDAARHTVTKAERLLRELQGIATQR